MLEVKVKNLPRRTKEKQSMRLQQADPKKVDGIPVAQENQTEPASVYRFHPNKNMISGHSLILYILTYTNFESYSGTYRKVFFGGGGEEGEENIECPQLKILKYLLYTFVIFDSQIKIV